MLSQCYIFLKNVEVHFILRQPCTKDGLNAYTYIHIHVANTKTFIHKHNIMSNLQPNFLRTFSDSDGGNDDEFQFCMEHLNDCDDTNSNSNLQNAEDYQVGSGDETEEEMNDDTNNINLTEEEVEKLFVGGTLNNLTSNIVSNFLGSKHVAPSYDEFLEIYLSNEESLKYKMFLIQKNTSNFKRFCSSKRHEYKVRFEQENPNASFVSYRKKLSARKHRVLKQIYIDQLISYINLKE